MKKLLLLIISFAFVPVITKAQHNQYQFSHLTVNNGLSNNHVTTILKDSRGFMWFGTVAGLNRYDGYKFKSFRHDLIDTSSLNDDYITNILEARDNKLWIKTPSGYNIYDLKTEQIIPGLATYFKGTNLPTSQIANIYKNGEGNILLLHRTLGIYFYNPITKQTKHYFSKKGQAESISSIPINSIASDSKNNLWIIHTDSLLEKFDTHLNKVSFRLNISGKAKDKQLYSIFIDKQDGIWMYSPGSDIGLYYFDTAKSILRHFDQESILCRLNSNIINSITQDDDGRIWIATDHGGINLLDKNSLKVQYLVNREDDSKSLAQNSVVSIYKDNLGIIWAGTFKKGINYFHKNIIKFPVINHHSSDPNSLPFNDVDRFVEDAKGNLWIGTNGGGLIYYDRHSGAFKRYKHDPKTQNSVSSDVIVSLCIDHNQKLWIGGYFGGLDCFDGKQFKHYRHNENNPSSLSDDRVWEIMEDSSNQLWVGTLAGGLNRYDSNKNIFYHYKQSMPNSILSNYISAIVEDKSGNIWLGTSGGIDEIVKSSGKIVHYLHNDKDPASLLHHNITNLLIDSRGWVWAATRHGVSVLDPETKKFKNFNKGNGLPENNILDILEDDKHNIWLSTTNGLSNMVIGNSKNTLAYKFNNYDEADGLQGLEFNESASYKTRKGELIFGGANGFNIFYPSNITLSKNEPDIVLTDFQLFNKVATPGQKINGHVILSKSIGETEHINLKYYENVFSIEFAALDFFNPDKIKIQYMLEGFDKDWLTTDNKVRKASYTNLDPSSYTFKIRAINNNSLKPGKQLTLHIIVESPFWKTPLAYALYFILFATGLFLIRRRGINKLKTQFAIQQEREQAHRLHELDMMKIKFFTNVSHEFRTPLSLILAPVDKILKQTDNPEQRQQMQLINRNAKRLLNLVNQLLDFRKMEVQELKLQNKNGDIIKFIEELTLSFSDIAEKKNISFVFDSDIDAYETAFDQDKIERILFNLLSNAFKFTPERGHISVLLSLQASKLKEADILEIKVIDTGIGIPNEKQDKIFERFFQNDVPGFMVNQGSGIGLAITKEFVKLHQGEIFVDSEIGEGSCFTVKLPIHRIKFNHDEVSEIIPTDQGLPAVLITEKVSEKKPTILLIEDNDDFRFYLKDNLKEYFHVIEATNGKEGWQRALALHPNLIVSDISMPEMNGIDLCYKLKSDNRTTHIPVVLLTALTGEEQQLRGLETGATDYLTKPFNFEILLSKLKNILSQQDLMRKTYKKQVEVKPSEIVVESPDEQFIQKALQVIERNISNTDFSVEELSSEMYMSRVTLYKKALALTGKSPVELIRSVRLKRAVQLLENGHLTVSQVCYKVGFKSQKYFTKSFKAEFNSLPSAFQTNRKAETIK